MRLQFELGREIMKNLARLGLFLIVALAPLHRAASQSLDLATAKIIDLSHAFDANTIY
jgi:hypothetical protein